MKSSYSPVGTISRSASFLEGARVTRSRRQLFAMRGGRWKIFKDQNHVWLEEHRVYHRDANGRVVAENDDAISSRYGMMMRQHARVAGWKSRSLRPLEYPNSEIV
jgi:hypothetical protein